MDDELYLDIVVEAFHDGARGSPASSMIPEPPVCSHPLRSSTELASAAQSSELGSFFCRALVAVSLLVDIEPFPSLSLFLRLSSTSLALLSPLEFNCSRFCSFRMSPTSWAFFTTPAPKWRGNLRASLRAKSWAEPCSPRGGRSRANEIMCYASTVYNITPSFTA